MVLVLACVSSAFANATEELFIAVMNPQTTPKAIEKLIKSGANVKAKYREGITALIVAAMKNSNPEVVKALIKAGADVNAKANNGMTALMLATANSNSEVVQTLISAGANVNAKD
ncbi:MAG: ankyrin repeat domain-containing protein, partial [Synergistaceae bacterium]|nr:ankyrin repeat domain-containing protein [Synergistaceae bacterium]